MCFLQTAQYSILVVELLDDRCWSAAAAAALSSQLLVSVMAFWSPQQGARPQFHHSLTYTHCLHGMGSMPVNFSHLVPHRRDPALSRQAQEHTFMYA